jgi:hypothetical protein
MSASDTYVEIYRGRCHCGLIKYAATGHPQFSFLCHCDDCRWLNGGARLAGAAFASNQLSVVGESKAYTYRGGKGDVEQHFCPNCGTPVYAYPKADGVVVVRINSLEDQNAIPPQKSIHGDQACAWDQLL